MDSFSVSINGLLKVQSPVDRVWNSAMPIISVDMDLTLVALLLAHLSHAWMHNAQAVPDTEPVLFIPSVFQHDDRLFIKYYFLNLNKPLIKIQISNSFHLH
jgi:hypothetical protein